MTSEEASEPLAAARKAIAEKRFDDAVQLLTALVNSSPDDPEALLLLGTAYAENRAYPHALACFNKSLSLRPSARGYYNVAALYRLQGFVAPAKKALREALKIDPQYSRAVRMLSELEAAEASGPDDKS